MLADAKGCGKGYVGFVLIPLSLSFAIGCARGWVRLVFLPVIARRDPSAACGTSKSVHRSGAAGVSCGRVSWCRHETKAGAGGCDWRRGPSLDSRCFGSERPSRRQEHPRAGSHRHLVTVNVISSCCSRGLNRQTSSTTAAMMPCGDRCRWRRKESTSRSSPNSSHASLNDSVIPSV